MKEILPEFMNYWHEVGILKFIRVFWYFLFFEFTRYVIIDYLIAFIYWVKRDERKQAWEQAKNALRTGAALSSWTSSGSESVCTSSTNKSRIWRFWFR